MYFDARLKFILGFLISLIVALLIFFVVEAIAEPGEITVDSGDFTDDIAKGRFDGQEGTEVSGISWCALWANGAAEIVFYTVEYNGAGAVYDSIPDAGYNGNPFYSLRSNIPKTYQFQAAYVDSYKIVNTNASEVHLTWQ